MSNTNKHYIEEEYATEQSRFSNVILDLFSFTYFWLTSCRSLSFFNFWVSSYIHSTSSVGFLFSYFNEH